MTLMEQWQDALKTLPLVAILRGLRPAEALGVGEMLVKAGFRIVEVPLNSPDPFDSIKLLVQALGKIDLPSLPTGASMEAQAGERVVVGGAGGRTRSLAGHIAARQEFAGYWEYLIDDAIFTYPAHPNWGGTAVISHKGELIGIGSLQLEREREGRNEHLNMIVPIDLLKPILNDMRRFGRVDKPVRPWLGVYSTEIEDKVVIVGIAPKGPAARAELKTGDVILAVAGETVSSLAGLYRKVWSLGHAGVEVPMTLYREGLTFEVRVNSSDRTKFLRAPRMH